MNAEILCVGTELLLGDIVNTNAAYLSRELAALGIGCYYQSVVGDNAQRLRESVSLAFSRADMVITTGGLGPTYDDITKEVVAEYFGLEMELHQPSLDHIHDIFTKIGRPCTKNNEKQAYLPKGATVLDNERGTAPGIAIEAGGKVAVMLPGPPSEMKAMFEGKVKPFLQAKTDRVLRSHTIHLFGVGESSVESQLHDAMVERTNPTIAPYAKMGEVQLRVTASAKDEAEAETLIQPVIDEITALFPDNVYGVDVENLQTALARRLFEKEMTIAIAESCTGGMIAARLTEIPGISKSLAGGVVSYSDESKMKLLGVSEDTLSAHGAVSPETALEMAKGVKEKLGVQVGLSVTGIAGPDGGTPEKPVGLCYIACVGSWGEEVSEMRLSRGMRDEREFIRNYTCLNAMNMALKLI
ncbi:MAG: competence/damage-inducible protein A [Oscillospiraceae bacterium]|nr:competence/damage-inducible protein A [Oscillospiraceae bacterium]